MQKTFFTAVLTAVMAAMSCTETSAQTLKASFTDVGNDTILVSVMGADPKTGSRRDTLLAKDGKFEYSLKDNKPARAQFYAIQHLAPNKPEYKPFGMVLVPGEHAVVSGTTDNFTITGSAFYTEYGKAVAPLNAFDRERAAVIAKYRPQLSDEKADPAIVEKLRAECAQLVSAISEKRKAATIDYIKAHPSSDVSVALVTDMGLNSIEEGVKLLTDAARQSSIAPLYKNVLEEIKAYREKKAKGMALEGKPAPSFTLNDINGKPLKLESLRGKYVVLDFWGSWCGWCIKGIPEMKKYYDKYKDKMEILGIDCNDTEAKWKAAVAKHELAWKHVRNAGQTDVTKLYYIQGYPTKIIVAPDGVVKKVAVGEDPEFYKYLDSLFK